ncbi:MAG TPA: ATP-binding protein, partial [Brevibacterium ravenspurgense]|nr:ATP-binding protein [Brevibacterium ravenspurgense]
MTGEAQTTHAGVIAEVGEAPASPAGPAEARAYTVIKPKARAIGATSAVALWGLSGTVIAVEASINNGLPGIDIVGLPDASVSEAR